MGLTIGYRLKFKGSHEEARSVICGLHQAALDLPFKRVGDLKDLQGPDCSVDALPAEDPVRLLLACLGEGVPFIAAEGDKEGLKIELRQQSIGPEAVIGFRTLPGDGCEEADFGLCRYPEFVETPQGRIGTGLRGWYWHGFCKTQYASNPRLGGVSNFLHCHLGVISLLDKAKALACKVHVEDDGEFWETRDPKRLLKSMSDYNGLTASVVGSLADEVELEAPIRDYPDFEHWEALGESGESLRILDDQVRAGPSRTAAWGTSSHSSQGASRTPEDVVERFNKQLVQAFPALFEEQEQGDSAGRIDQRQVGACGAKSPRFKDKHEGRECLIAALFEYLSDSELLEILDRGADPLYRDNECDESALEVAARECPSDQVEPILRHLNSRGFDFRSSSRVALCLTAASLAGNFALVELLLNWGASPDLPHKEFYSPLVQVMLRREELADSIAAESGLGVEEEFCEEESPEFFEYLEGVMVESGGDRQRALNTTLAIEACWLDRESAKAFCAKGADPSEALRYTVRAHPRASREAAELLVALGADIHRVREGDILALLRSKDSFFRWRNLELARWLVVQGSALLLSQEILDFILATGSGHRALVWGWDSAVTNRFLARRFPALRRGINAWRETISM